MPLRCTIAAICFFALPAFAQDWASKLLERTSNDFGTVARGADVVHQIKITNNLNSTVHIAGIRSSCSCTSPSLSTEVLEPGEEGYLILKLDTIRHVRQKNATVYLTFDLPQYAEVPISIKAYIRTDIVLTPGRAEFGSLAVGQGGEQKIDIEYAGRKDWKIKEVESKNELIETELKEITREAGKVHYELYVRLKKDAPLGEIREQIYLKTDDANSPTIPILVEGKVEADVTITPSLVTLGTLRPGQKKTVNLVVRGRKPFKIEKIESESGSAAYSTVKPERTATAHIVPLIVVVPEDATTLEETFTLTISGEESTYQFKVQGKVSKGT